MEGEMLFTLWTIMADFVFQRTESVATNRQQLEISVMHEKRF